MSCGMNCNCIRWTGNAEMWMELHASCSTIGYFLTIYGFAMINSAQTNNSCLRLIWGKMSRSPSHLSVVGWCHPSHVIHGQDYNVIVPSFIFLFSTKYKCTHMINQTSKATSNNYRCVVRETDNYRSIGNPISIGLLVCKQFINRSIGIQPNIYKSIGIQTIIYRSMGI